MDTVITQQGDTFDLLAKRVYGDERRMDVLMEANPAQMGTVVFSAGVRLLTPPPAEERGVGGVPPWRRV